MSFLIKAYSYDEDFDREGREYFKEFETLEETLSYLESIAKSAYISVEKLYVESSLNVECLNEYLVKFRNKQIVLYKYLDAKRKHDKLLDKKDRLAVSLNKNKENLSEIGIQKKLKDISDLETQIKKSEEVVNSLKKESDNHPKPKFDIKNGTRH